jgi:hypothetical protein
MLLRLRKEPEPEIENESAADARSVPLPEPSDRIESPDVFPDEIFPEETFPEEDGLEPDEPAPFIPVRGIQIAVATFLPTLLVVFFGLPYLLGGATPTRAPNTSAPPASLTAPLTPELTAPPMASTSPSAGEPGGSNVPVETSPLSTVESTDQAPVAPTLPPVEVPPAEPRLPAPNRRTPASPRPATAEPATPDPTRIDSQKTAAAADWTPAAAFADRAAAGRLAGSIEAQGYPVEIRQDGSSTRPWVVWIGARPKSGSGRRR